MAYRLVPPPIPCGSDINDSATETAIVIDNGTISRIAFPCMYVGFDPRNRDIEDHVGWPEPRRPDRSSQLPERFNCTTLEPIELSLEGYTEIIVATNDNKPDGVELYGFIDDNVITLQIDAMCRDAQENDVSFEFAMYAIGETMEYDAGDDSTPIQLRDLVTKGSITIKAGILEPLI